MKFEKTAIMLSAAMDQLDGMLLESSEKIDILAEKEPHEWTKEDMALIRFCIVAASARALYLEEK